MQTQTQLSPQLENAIDELSKIVAPALAEIHSLPATTKNYYGDYMNILTPTKTAGKCKLLALALIKAGANVYGVEDAVKILDYK